MKQGMAKHTGTLISGEAYLNQRFADALGTYQGTLVGERTYGADLEDLIDENITELFRMKLFSRIANALQNPVNDLTDFTLRQLELIEPAPHRIEVIAHGQWQQQSVSLRSPVSIAAPQGGAV
ncbi:Uncharacterised protein [BD1-7 clade bacterium]|uniref:IraD/Gp25-like domain-containing protein n=1 Tax=BD1-7 clade bacterium TaxID=2029982 RepID=A0A5S9QTJ7_9GAMM|nr:Uncharacterised protein [BD1-7 clade bacterium]CAA0122848.1 Uncharacterised protein [BD1-7 clade bacterium]